MKSRKPWLLGLGIALAAAAAIAAASLAGIGPVAKKTAKSGVAYDFSTVARGTLESVVTASGTIEPVSEVSVLAEMNGRVEKIYADYNDKVTKGQSLVSLDTGTLELDRRQAAAAVDKAEASRDLASVDYENKKALSAKGLIADYDLASSRTSLEVADAELEQAKASLDAIDTELQSYAIVRSPISGIVLERNVDVGQSVVAGGSSGSTSLFTLAGDLSKVEIEASVDELDIAAIRPGQEVRFSVEALPGKTYDGVVRQVRLVPTTSDNVVSYTVIVDAANGEGKLLPGMSATLTFIKDVRKNVLLVPNAALRFSPPDLGEAEKARKLFIAGLSGMDEGRREAAIADYDARVAQAEKAKNGSSNKIGGLTSVMMPSGPGGPRGGGPGGPPGEAPGNGARASSGGAASEAAGAVQAAGAGQAVAERKALWYLDNQGEFQAVLVTVGATDGSKTEVEGGPSLEGLSVVVKEKI